VYLSLIALYAGLLLFGGVSDYANPLFIVEPVWARCDLPELAKRLFLWVAVWGSTGLIAQGLAAWRLRPSSEKFLGASRGAGRGREAHALPPIGDDPVRWKECHIEGLAALAWLRQIPYRVKLALVAVLSATLCLWILWAHLPLNRTLAELADVLLRGDGNALYQYRLGMNDPTPAWCALNGTALFLGALFSAVRGSETISGERERETWDSLVLTGIDGYAIVYGKVMGILVASVPFVLAYGLPMLVCSFWGGTTCVMCTLYFLAIAGPMLVFFAGVGLYRSSFHTSTRKSLPHAFFSASVLLCCFGLAPAIYAVPILIAVGQSKMFLKMHPLSLEYLALVAFSLIAVIGGAAIVGVPLLAVARFDMLTAAKVVNKLGAGNDQQFRW
jgi:hypothetical protein